MGMVRGRVGVGGWGGGGGEGMGGGGVTAGDPHFSSISLCF